MNDTDLRFIVSFVLIAVSAFVMARLFIRVLNIRDRLLRMHPDLYPDFPPVTIHEIDPTIQAPTVIVIEVVRVARPDVIKFYEN